MSLRIKVLSLWVGALALVLTSAAGCATKKELQVLKGELGEFRRELRLNREKAAELASEGRERGKKLAELTASLRGAEARLKRTERELGVALARLDRLARGGEEAGGKPLSLPSPQRAFKGLDSALKPLPLYKRSLANYRAGLYRMALRGFEEFLRLFPQHRLSENAQYWLAESYYGMKDYGRALTEFEKVLKGWKGGKKAPDAMLKVGFCLLAKGETEKGKRALRRLIALYPAHRASELARARLRGLGAE